MLNEEERQKIARRYEERLSQYGVDIRTLNPGSEEKHRIQHAVHASIGDLNNRTVLDIGCGLAHYYQFLSERGIKANYIGYDIVEPFIEINRQRFPEAHFEVRDISRDGIAHRPDYITMCQVFNNKYDSVSNEEVVRNAIATALDAAQVGVSIDMLSKYVNYEEEHLNYFSPEEMLSYAKSLTRFVILRHDYLPFDFTLFLYKEATGK
jgi:SAM-dependent methyltransferase